ncbi:baseplate J/gp47 family protein [Aquamicrobium sp.]|uniref:baseplate J/gp47 family protein n=1 Tax=Aquamicrobium sp. TaxID=1872579 RepID=UPI00258E0288|nr:baseplate J/gp47 family protein [Aquamicrobium sp.]MCK9549631.1 baseplate J/gp47 family protein [Aquamicrobium sp.]
MTIDLSTLPPPNLVRPLDPEPEIAAFIADLQERLPEWRGVFQGDPFVRACQSWAYRLMLEQQRHNEDGRSILLAYAQGADLDHIAATYYAFAGIVRADGETDTSLRRRIQLAPEAYSSAGSLGGYLFHTLTVDPVAIVDADVWFPAPGYANVAIQTIHDDTDSAAAADLAARVDKRLREPRLQTSDVLAVGQLNVIDTAVVAAIDVPIGPDGALIEAEARRRFALLKASVERPRRMLAISAITAALHAGNVSRVRLAQPAQDIVPAAGHRVRITALELAMERTDG